MVKVQKKKKLSDHINTKKDDKKTKKTLNPFEIHINREKHKVLGRKLKSDRGLPGVARSKAIKKRKHTLLQEYKVQNKSNKFFDRRIGEKNGMMSHEDRAIARFTAERIKSHNKKSIFNLADDEVLTHKGQNLSEIEKFDDPRSEDDSEDEEGRTSSGKLDDDFVDNAHFGGGILKKTGQEGAKSHKDLIDQLIAESKKRKAEKQKIREQTLDLTAKLDSEWKDLLPIVNKSKKTDDQQPDTRKNDDYDRVMRELKFEARGKPSDRLKTEEEIAKEEKERLEKLEQERLDRMKGITDNKDDKKPKHRSADDLDDNFAYDSDPEVMLAYDSEGKSLINLQETEGETEDKDDQEEQDEEESEEEDDSEVETEDDLDDLKGSDDSESEEDATEAAVNEETVEDNSEEETNEVMNIETAEDIVKEEAKDVKMKKTEIISNEGDQETESQEETVDLKDVKPSSAVDIKADLLVRKDMMEKARKELPYTFAMPDSYEALQTLLVNHSAEYQSIIVERIIKCNHPSLAEANKENLGKLFIYLLQHLNDVSVETYSDTNVKTSFQVFNSLIPHMYDLAQTNPINALNSLIEILREKQADYRKSPKSFPGIEVLIFLKLISLLFPTSDFRHQAVTPSVVFMDQMLTNCRVKTQKDVAYGLFLVTLLLEYITLSKRFIPSATTFLTGVLHMTIPKTGVQLLKIAPPFKSHCTQLVVIKKHTKKTDLEMKLDDFITEGISEDFKLRSFYTAVKLAEEFHDLWKVLPSSNEIFGQLSKFLDKVPLTNYPEMIVESVNKLKNQLTESKNSKKLDFIVPEKKKPKALRLYEPNIVQIFDCKRRKIQSKEKAEKEKLLHKYKQERKGALREIRRDRAFLGRLKIKQQIQSDVERKEKVRRIFADASVQQSELNAIDRKKKKK